jgi:hypothetical protein
MPIPMPRVKGHVMPRGWELFFALVFVLMATYLLYDAYDWRNKQMPWPLSGLFWG